MVAGGEGEGVQVSALSATSHEHNGVLVLDPNNLVAAGILSRLLVC